MGLVVHAVEIEPEELPCIDQLFDRRHAWPPTAFRRRKGCLPWPESARPHRRVGMGMAVPPWAPMPDRAQSIRARFLSVPASVRDVLGGGRLNEQQAGTIGADARRTPIASAPAGTTIRLGTTAFAPTVAPVLRPPRGGAPPSPSPTRHSSSRVHPSRWARCPITQPSPTRWESRDRHGPPMPSWMELRAPITMVP